MCHYTHLTPFEREKILFFLAVGKSITEIAHLLSQSKSTISRELRRNAAPAKHSMPCTSLWLRRTATGGAEPLVWPHKRLENASLRSFVQICIAVPLVAGGDCWPRPARAWLPHHQRLDDLPRSACWPAESNRDICEVRPPETASSWEAPSQEGNRRASWEVRHLASHRGAPCQCRKTHRPWPLEGRYVPILFPRSAPSMGTRDQREHQWAPAGVLPEGHRYHGHARGLYPTEIP